MADITCSDVVRFGGDPELAPEHLRDGLAAHLTACPDCASYVSQIATTRDILRGHSRRRPVRATTTPTTAPPTLTPTATTTPPTTPTTTAPTTPPTTDAGSVRSTLLARAELLDPRGAEDLTQQALEVGLALQRRDSRPRGVAELTTIMHVLHEAQARLDGRSTPAVDVTAAARARVESLEGFDADADEPELFYPDLYPGDDGADGWVDSPSRWRSGSEILGPEEAEETGDVYRVVDSALDELPEPLGEILTLVDVQGAGLSDSARALGLDQAAATAALARARNHVRGRLDEYLGGPKTMADAPR